MAESKFDWINYENLRAAVDQVRAGSVPKGVKVSLSRNWYIIDPSDLSAWDLKVVIKVASVIEADLTQKFAPFSSYNFSPAEPKSSILNAGFYLLWFDEPGKRNVGLSKKFDPSAFEEEHWLILPDYTEHKNGLQAQNSDIKFQTPNSSVVPRALQAILRFGRNPMNVRIVLERAKGVCDCCKKTAFKTLKGDWFLEVHHKTWLSEGGPDTVVNMVALCPNCHRQEHFGERKYR